MNRHGNRRLPSRGRNKAGFTLIEVMVSLVLLALGMLASVIGIMSAINHSMVNDIRNQAIAIAQAQAELVANTPFTNIKTLAAPTSPVYKQVRNGQVAYSITEINTPYPNTTSPTLYQINIAVSWTAKENIFSDPKLFGYTLNTIVGQ